MLDPAGYQLGKENDAYKADRSVIPSRLAMS
jgi:hypothetical protein